VFAPERAAELLAHGDDVVQAAILSQASEGEVAKKAHALSLVPNALSDDERYVATRMSAWEPSVWTSLATQALFSEPEGTKVPGYSAALAARVQPHYEGGAPSVHLVREWLDAGDLETRAATAHGLGAARGASAAGLIVHAYRRETAPEVRRALAGSMLRHPDLGPRRARAIVRLDEDATTRRRVSLATRESVTSFTIQLSNRKRETFLDPEGRRLWVAPAPDGFIGVVHR
jgi:hypothetical protein